MIVSHTHRYIFFAVPKTATQSIRHFLAPHLEDADWQQQALYRQELAPIPELAALGHGHISASQALSFLPDNSFDDYFKFAFVRDPVDRFVSASHFLFRDDPAFIKDPLGMMKNALGRERFRRRILIRPQTELLSLNGKVAMNFVGRFERLQEDFAQVLAQLGISQESLPKLNRSEGDGQSTFVDDALRAVLHDFYREDFQAFGY